MPMKLFWALRLIELPQGLSWEHGAAQGGSSSPLKELEGQITAFEASSGRASCTLCFPRFFLLRQSEISKYRLHSQRMRASLGDSRTNVSYSAAWSGLVGAWICLAGTQEVALLLPSLRSLASPFSLGKEQLDHTQSPAATKHDGI